MTDKNNANHQPINEPVFLLETTFLINAYEKWENFEEPRMLLNLNGESYPVYNLLLYEFLFSESVPLTYPQGKTIKGDDFVASYVQGYNLGIADFDKWFSPIAFQGPNADSFVNSLHRKCIHQYDDRLGGNGWIEAVRKVPYEVSNRMVELYGFYNALLAKYDQLMDMYKELFKKLVLCEYAETNAEQFGKNNTRKNRTPLKVTILPGARERVYEALKPLVLEPQQHVALRALIDENIIPTPPIKINAIQVGLSYLFRILYDTGFTTGSLDNIAQVISSSFAEMNYDTIFEYLRKRTMPGEPSLIKIDLDFPQKLI